MEEEASSWIRRTKFSHTICHRLDTSRLTSLPLTLPERESGLKARPKGAGTAASFDAKLIQNQSRVQVNPLTNKQRSLSPQPTAALSDTFKEARSSRKRFSTPRAKRGSNKNLMGKHKSTSPSKQQTKSSYSTSPLRHLGSLRVSDGYKGKKESAWAKYFDHHGGVRVTAVEAADEHNIDLSQLFLGLKFAHGAHSRLYHGIYKDEPVAVKIIRTPDDDENETMASRLEKQFNREVTLLSRLHHPNVIKVSSVLILPSCFGHCLFCLLLGGEVRA